jgi:hypothetical protein
MLAIPKLPFLLIGACEALAQLLLMVGAAKLPAPMLPLLMQTSMIWSLLFARLILGTRWGPGPSSRLGRLGQLGPCPAEGPAHLQLK